jgi:branched-chain amino acid transport system substrate-binding protein
MGIVKFIVGKALLPLLMVAALVAPTVAKELNIAVVISTTGKYAFVGTPLKDGIDMALAERAKAGIFGNNTINVIFQDNASEKDEAISLINRMGARKDILMIIGPIATSEAMATGPVAVDHKITMFTTATSPKALDAGPWIFKVTGIADNYMAVMGEYAVDTLKVKKCFSVTIRDNEGYIIQKNAFVNYLNDHGSGVVADESILSSDTDFTAMATKIVNANPDCLFLSTPPEQGANIIIQAKQAGLSSDVILIGNTGMASVNYLKAGGSAVNGTYLPTEFLPTGVHADAKAFIDRYKAAHGEEPKLWAAVGYTMGLVAAAAISNAGDDPTRDSIRRAMLRIKDLSVPLGFGRFTIGADRIPNFGASVLVIRDGDWISVD